MRKTLFVVSWKANMTTRNQINEFFAKFGAHAARFTNEVVLCPSYIHLDRSAQMMPQTVKLGAQDVSRHNTGPHTGEIHAAALADLGVKYCIVGHVERRVDGETDTRINQKIKNLLANGITPIICVGETLAEYKNNTTRVVIERQIRDCMTGVKEWDKVILAYQPIWSIGTAHYTSGEYTSIILDFMRKTMQKVTGQPMAGNITMLYGGGVTRTNVAEYLSRPECDGIMWALGATDPANIAAFESTPFTKGHFNK